MVSWRIFCLISLAIVACGADKTCSGSAICIAIDSCSGIINGLKKGNPFFLQLVSKLHCGFEAYDVPKICCPPEFQSNVNVDSRFGEDSKEYTVQPLSPLPSYKVCGKQNGFSPNRQAETKIDEHPWTALIGYSKPNGWGFHCGGVLISSKFVLTAASCEYGPDLPIDWQLEFVVLGEWNTSSIKDCQSGECSDPPLKVDVDEIIVHEMYDKVDDDQLNDIALLKLKQEVQFTNFIRPICLPTTEELRQQTFTSYEMQVAGWGESGSRSQSDVKLKTRVTVIPKEQCSEKYQWILMTITDSQMCAVTNRGRNAMMHRRDSGSALMVQYEGNWVAVGVTSYGPMFYRAAPKFPSVYTRVGPYIDWIEANMKPLSKMVV